MELSGKYKFLSNSAETSNSEEYGFGYCQYLSVQHLLNRELSENRSVTRPVELCKRNRRHADYRHRQCR